MTGSVVTPRALRRYFPPGRAGRFVLLQDPPVVFVKNAKAACSTITLWLNRVHTGDHSWVPERNVHAEHSMPRPNDVGWREVARMLSGEAFRFSFVREPLARAESAYRDKVVREKRDKWRFELCRALGLPEEPGVPPTVDQYVASLEAQDPIEMDPHWRPQHLNLLHPLVEYDLIGRLESFDADFARLREMAQLPDIPVEVRNRTARGADNPFDSRPDLRRRLEAVYARDFELYGY